MREFKTQSERQNEDESALEGAKELVKKNKKPLHRMRLNKNTVIISTMAENLERYKHIEPSINY